MSVKSKSTFMLLPFAQLLLEVMSTDDITARMM